MKHIHNLILEKGYQIGNIDTTIICEKPKIKPYISSIQTNLSEILGINHKQISIKATTTEKLGFCGREEGIAVQAVCLLEKTT